MQSILENLKNISFINNEIPAEYAKDFPEIISAEVFINPLPITVKNEAIFIHKIETNSEILYFSKKDWDNGSYSSILVTTEFISVHWTVSNKINRIYFKDVSKVEEYSLAVINFFDSNDDRLNNFDFHNFYLILKDYNDTLEFAQELDNLIKYYNGKSDTINKLKVLEDGYNEFCKKYREDEILYSAQIDFSNQILLFYDQHIIKFGYDNLPIDLKYYEYLAYHYISEHNKALEIATNVIELYDGDLSLWYERRALTLKKLGNIYNAILNYKEASRLSGDSKKKIEYRDNVLQLQKHYNDLFNTLPYQERKLILIDNELKSTPEDSFIVLDKNNLPTNLQFPNKIAKNKELYIAHPFVNGSYIPFVNYEEELATNKFKEFFYFVQCLGAKKITYKIIEGNDSEKISDRNLDIDANIGLGKSVVKNTLDVGFEKNNHKNSIDKNLLATSQSQTFTPTKAPYLPEKLLFYPHEMSWHWLYEQRLAGGFDSHKEEITSKKSEIINESEKMNLKIAFKNLFVDASVNINHLVEETFKQNKLKKWLIEIEFEPIENLKNVQIDPILIDNGKATYTNIEQEYLEELQFMLEDDGLIDDKERKFLERFRKKIGISERRAIEIENNLINNGNLTQDEKEYLEEYQELINDGEISDKERRILSRMANRFNIPEKRVIQLEKLKSIK